MNIITHQYGHWTWVKEQMSCVFAIACKPLIKCYFASELCFICAKQHIRGKMSFIFCIYVLLYIINLSYKIKLKSQSVITTRNRSVHVFNILVTPETTWKFDKGVQKFRLWNSFDIKWKNCNVCYKFTYILAVIAKFRASVIVTALFSLRLRLVVTSCSMAQRECDLLRRDDDRQSPGAVYFLVTEEIYSHRYRRSTNTFLIIAT